MPNLTGQSIGRYHILEQLGEGGMAIVYKAYDTRLETDVAVKFIRTENLPQSGVEKALKRFEREAKALAKLTHPNIVPIIDYGEYEGSPYLVMKYLPGGTLKQTLQGQPLPWQAAAALLIPVARALDYAHRQGMIHRDVKPSNILITADGEPMLTDFGIAKVIDQDLTMDLTGTSATVGTPEYMAPEQVVSKAVDQRADIYALGIVFYEMLTGRRPFEADTPMAVLFKHASEPLPRPRQFVPALPERVEKVLFKALAKKPEDRYQSMEEFAGAFDALVREQSPVSQTLQVPLKHSSTSAAGGAEVASPQPEGAIPPTPELSTLIPTKIPAPASSRKKRFPRVWLLVGLIPVVVTLGWFAWQLSGQFAAKNAPAVLVNTPTPLMPATKVPTKVIPPTEPLLPATLAPLLPAPAACKDDKFGCAVFSPRRTIRIGMGAPMTGGNAAFGQDVSQAARMAVADAGQFNGFSFELVINDDMGTEKGGVDVANKFVSDPQVVAIAGHIFSAASQAAIPIYEAAGLPMMSPSATNPSLTALGSRVFNRCVFTDFRQAKRVAGYLYTTLNVKKLAILHDGGIYGLGIARMVNQLFTEVGGSVVSFQSIPPGGSDYRTVLASIAASQPRALYYGGYTPEAVVIVNQMKQAGLENVIFFGDDGTFGQDFLDRTGANGEGTYSTSLIPPASDARMKFDNAYLAAYDQPPGKLSPYTWTGYDAAAILIRAIESVAILNPDGRLYIPRDGLVTAVRSTKDYRGLSGAITCDSSGECSASSPTFVVDRGGKWVEAPR